MAELIGLHGRLGSGKDTAFEVMQKVAAGPNAPQFLKGKTVKRDAFADRLKQSAAAALGYRGPNPVNFCNWLKGDTTIMVMDEGGNFAHGLTGREYLQYYGTEAHREVFDTDFWISAVLPDLDDPWFGRTDLHQNTILVVTDVRFSNEAEAIRAAGGVVWEVDASKRNPPAGGHASEQRLPKELIDYVLDNNGTLDDLEGNVRTAFSPFSIFNRDRELSGASNA